VKILIKEGSVARSFQPLGDRVVIKPSDKDEVTKSGLVIPDIAKEKPQEGEVVAVGPGRVADDGKRIAMEVKAGDKVVYSKYAGTDFKEDEDEFLIVRETDILARIS
jgi:chaperonin GroES